MSKKILIWIIIAVMALTACAKDNAKPVENIGRESEFRKDLPELPYDPATLVEYIEENLDKVEQDKRELYLFVLEDSLVDNLGLVSSITQKEEVVNILKGYDEKDQILEEDLKTIKSDSVRNELQKLYDMKYKLYKRKSGFQITIDYEKLAQMAGDNESLKQYFMIKNAENINPSLDEGVVMISPSELLARLNTTENFLMNNSDFKKANEFLSRYQSWMFLLLSGTNLSPVVKDGDLTSEYRELYENLSPVSIADNTFRRGMELIEDNNFIFDDELMAKIRNIVTNSNYELKERMEMTK
ncbi:MAG: hypothetical protein PT956_02930 [Firmicutes bacterium]|nr:hypothetical protein [Bacillota bacterium]